MYNNNNTLCVVRDSGGGRYSHVTVHQSRRSLSGAAAGYTRDTRTFRPYAVSSSRRAAGFVPSPPEGL